MDKKYIINNLNDLLRGIYVDMNTFDNYINNSKNKNIISQVSKVRKDYEKHASRISKVISDLGGNPISMDSCSSTKLNSINNTRYIDEEILQKTCEATSNVLNLGHKLISDPNFINRESYTAINLMNKDYQKHINYIQKSELYNNTSQQN